MEYKGYRILATDKSINFYNWVHGADEHKTGSSGYEIGGEVVLRIGE